MNLIWFLTIGTVLSLVFGEFGQFPFGANLSISLTDILLGLTLMFLLIWQVAIKREILLPKGFKLLMFFWLVALISLVLSQNLSGGLYLLRFIFYSASFYLGYILIKSGRVREMDLIYLLIIPVSLFALAGFLQLYIMPDLAVLEMYGYDPHKNRLVSTFLDPNFAGTFLNFGLIYCLYFYLTQKKTKWLFLSVSIALALFLTFSRSAYLMSLVSVGLLGVFKFKKLLILLVVIFITAFAFVPRFQQRVQGIWNLDITATERIESWKSGFEIFKSSPLIGVGFNNISTKLEELKLLRTFQDESTHSVSGIDSSIIFILATTGILGLSFYLLFWGYILLKFIKNKKEGINLVSVLLILALFLNSQFVNSLFYPPIMISLFLLTGAFYAKSK